MNGIDLPASRSRKPRAAEIEGDIAYVELSQGNVSVIDAADAAFISQWNWQTWQSGSGKLYAGRRFGQKTVRLHQLLLPSKPGYVVDHVDGDGLNNRRSNLRYATARDNSRNVNATRKVPKGVYFQKHRNIYVARLHIGEFSSLDEASRAYDEVLRLVFPEFGRPNNYSQDETKKPSHHQG